MNANRKTKNQRALQETISGQYEGGIEYSHANKRPVTFKQQ